MNLKKCFWFLHFHENFSSKYWTESSTGRHWWWYHTHWWGSQGLSMKWFPLQAVCGFLLGIKSGRLIYRSFSNGLKSKAIFSSVHIGIKTVSSKKICSDTLKAWEHRVNVNACFSLSVLAGGLKTEVSSCHKIPIFAVLRPSTALRSANLLFQVWMERRFFWDRLS